MSRIPFDVDDPPITFFAGMHNGAAAHRAITADCGGLFGILGLEHPGAGFDRTQVKAQAADGKTGCCSSGDLNKLPSDYLYKCLLFWD